MHKQTVYDGANCTNFKGKLFTTVFTQVKTFMIAIQFQIYSHNQNFQVYIFNSLSEVLCLQQLTELHHCCNTSFP